MGLYRKENNMKALLAFLVVFCAACVSTPKQETPVLPDLAGKTVTVWIVADWERSDAQAGTVEGEVRKDPSPWQRVLWKVGVDPAAIVTYADLFKVLNLEHRIDIKFEVNGNGGGVFLVDEAPRFLNRPVVWEVLENGSSVDLIAEIPYYTLEVVTPPRFIKAKMKK